MLLRHHASKNEDVFNGRGLQESDCAMKLMFVLLLKVSSHVAGEVDQWLGTLAALPEDPDLCLSRQMVVHSYLYFQFWRM